MADTDPDRGEFLKKVWVNPPTTTFPVTHKVTVSDFPLPNHVTLLLPGVGKGSPTLDLADLSIETLDALCTKFRAGVFALAKKPDPKAPAQSVKYLEGTRPF